MWFWEGVTTYMGSIRQQKENTYKQMMESFYTYYLNYRKQGKDRAIGNMSQWDDDYDHTFLAQKGSIVAYILDKELNKTGHHIGQVAKVLYRKYGITRQGMPSNEDILSVFNEVSGIDFASLFNKYLYSAKRLPLDGNFEWICHH